MTVLGNLALNERAVARHADEPDCRDIDCRAAPRVQNLTARDCGIIDRAGRGREEALARRAASDAERHHVAADLEPAIREGRYGDERERHAVTSVQVRARQRTDDGGAGGVEVVHNARAGSVTRHAGEVNELALAVRVVERLDDSAGLDRRHRVNRLEVESRNAERGVRASFPICHFLYSELMEGITGAEGAPVTVSPS